VAPAIREPYCAAHQNATQWVTSRLIHGCRWAILNKTKSMEDEQ
jgi:hypothetical protein